MIKTTYDHVKGLADAFIAVCDADGIDALELAQAPLDAGRTENKIEIFDGPIRRNMINLGSATPASLAVLDLALTVMDAESFLCFVVLTAHGR